jgi:hypothetical protein
MFAGQYAYALNGQSQLAEHHPFYQFLSSADFIASRSDREGRAFCKSLIGLSKDEVAERFAGRTDTNPLGWICSEDRTLFSCGDASVTSQIELRYKLDHVVKVREIRSCSLFLPEAKDGRLVGKWVR